MDTPGHTNHVDPAVNDARRGGDVPPGGDYLTFTLAGVACAVPLAEVHEALRAIPPAVPLPDSPPWLLGIFPWRSDLLGLIDPAPVLTGKPRAARPPWRTTGAPGISQLAPSGRIAAPAPGGAAVVMGDDAVRVALAVDALGELVALPNQQRLPPVSGAPILTRYCTGVGTAPGRGARYAMLAVGPLLRDVVAALTERPEDVTEDVEGERHE
jgi:chemotaxis signal transduction protein